MPAWNVKIHKLVLSEDFKTITHADQIAILKAIRKKLTAAPYEYGKPLSGELRGYWRLRTGDYRVIYKINKDAVEVMVIKIGMRKDDEVYRKLIPRLKKLVL